MRTLEQKVDVELKDAHVGWRLEGVNNAYPQPESGAQEEPRKRTKPGTP